MAIGVTGFCKERLIQIREARGLTSGSLAEMLGVSASTVSQYEHGNQKPRQNVLDNLSQILNVPVSYFLFSGKTADASKIYFRSMSSATKFARIKVHRRYELLLESTDFLSNYVDFPELNVPEIDVPDDFREINSFIIESAAEQVRQYWLLGSSPVMDLVRTVESNGMLVWRTAFESETMDAFSEFRTPHPVIVLSCDKNNYYRSRFDLAHELGHFILHRSIKEKTLRRSPEFKIIEDQAHHFASAFLLPAKAFSDELWDASIDAFRSLKGRWKTSMATMIMRTRKLELINEDQERRLWINLARRGWKKREPLDDSTIPEEPTLLKQAFNMLIGEKILNFDQICANLHLHASDIENFAGVPRGYFAGETEMPEPKIKRLSNNVLEFSRKN